MQVLKEAYPSIRNLSKHPKLYLPDLFMYVVTYVLTVFFYKSSGLDATLKEAILNKAVTIDVFQNFLYTNWFQILISVIVFIIVTFFVGVGVTIVRYRLITSITNKKRMTLWKAIFNRKQYFFKVVFLKIYVYALSALMLIITTAIIVANKEIENDFLGISIKLFATLVGIAIILFIKMGIMYRYAILFLADEKRSYRALKRSFRILLKRPWLVIIVWFAIAVAGLGMGIVVSGVSTVANLLKDIFTGPYSSYLFSLIVVLIVYLIKLTYDLWSHLFVFSTFKFRKKLS